MMYLITVNKSSQDADDIVTHPTGLISDYLYKNSINSGSAEHRPLNFQLTVCML
jgi:hypothetical protein